MSFASKCSRATIIDSATKLVDTWLVWLIAQKSRLLWMTRQKAEGRRVGWRV